MHLKGAKSSFFERAMQSLAIFLPGLDGGGAERIMLNLARGFVEQGLKVDLVLLRETGPYLSQVPAQVRIVNLGNRRMLLSIPALIRYLQTEQPVAMLCGQEDINVAALWVKKITGVSTRIVVSVQNTLSQQSQNTFQLKRRLAPLLARWFYPWADAIVAVSQGVAQDLARLGLPLDSIQVIYNPVVTADLAKKVREPLVHPWFSSDQPPVILAVGRLDKQKDFPTLIRAFAKVREQRPVRLMVLGEGQERSRLETLVQKMKLTADVELPGFVQNPHAYMARAAVCVLSSAWEGFGNVLVEAMAAGTPVVSTDCESGPAEILVNGKYGKLVPVGDFEGMAKAIAHTLDQSQDSMVLKHRSTEFSLEKALASYLQALQLG